MSVAGICRTTCDDNVQREVSPETDNKNVDDDQGGSYINSIDDDPGEAEEGGELLEQDEQGERLFLRAPRVVRR